MQYGTGIKYEAKYDTSGGPATEGASVNFEFTEAPAGGPLPVTGGFDLASSLLHVGSVSWLRGAML